ncbi:unnamed protein product [Tetraodon nigroviridis]|uniref:Phospholipase A1 member A n=1 Tax=Tetraodon nigroviridis TaxID=99883 RepID=Q4RTQ6_TETNG|nr:unnamed protein product [Tetraodon nigroviridis]
MLWGHRWILLCVLTAGFTSLSLGVEENVKCADLNNTTWQQYRQHRPKLQVQYLLLTRRNLDCAQEFSQESLNNTHFNVSRPTKVIIHGYRVMGSKPSWVKELAQALLRVEDVNVLVVAVQVSILINQLQGHGCKLESFHFIGVSLGAHVAGFVGTLFTGKIGRITGLDPAGPMFKRADVYDRLDPSDAQFVEAIHTDSDNFGISIPVGHVDFFINGGNDQTGCPHFGLALMYSRLICDHMRALHVYISALNGSCPLVGIPCNSYDEFLTGQCLNCDVFKGKCPAIGLSKNSGVVLSPLPKEQKLFLLTSPSSPFCAHHILLELEVSPLEKRAELGVTLRTGSVAVEQKLGLGTGATLYRSVLAHPMALCEIGTIELRNTGSRFYRQGEVHVKSVCLSELPSLRREKPLCVIKFNVRRGTPCHMTWSRCVACSEAPQLAPPPSRPGSYPTLDAS